MIDTNNYFEQGAVMNMTDVVVTETVARPGYDQIVTWCRDYVAQTLGISPAKVDPNAEFDALGFDSAAAVALVVELGTWLNMDLEPAVLFDFPTISAFAEYLSKQ